MEKTQTQVQEELSILLMSYTDMDSSYDIGKSIEKICTNNKLFHVKQSFENLILDNDFNKYNELYEKKWFKIYRGQLSHIKTLGYSWTINKKVAKFFANRQYNPLILEVQGYDKETIKNIKPIILESKIKFDDLFLYINDRNEDEIFVPFPKQLKTKIIEI
tara:strand:+ start:190 stop:672 length:483 start_codon:yes stop_codon:yes gene_type:complete